LETARSINHSRENKFLRKRFAFQMINLKDFGINGTMKSFINFILSRG
jgi:hypothetical protein